MKFLNDIQFHEWEDMPTDRKLVRAILTFQSQMEVSRAMMASSGSREIQIRTRQVLSESIQREIFGDVITELSELREQLFRVNDPSVIPVMDRVTSLINKLRKGRA